MPVFCELRVAASLFDASVVAATILAAVVKETGRYNDRWRFSRRQEFDAASFSGRKNTSQTSSTIRTTAFVVTIIATDPTATRA